VEEIGAPKTCHTTQVEYVGQVALKNRSENVFLRGGWGFDCDQHNKTSDRIPGLADSYAIR
jgi:hypothetical protein